MALAASRLTAKFYKRKFALTILFSSRGIWLIDTNRGAASWQKHHLARHPLKRTLGMGQGNPGIYMIVHLPAVSGRIRTFLL